MEYRRVIVVSGVLCSNPVRLSLAAGLLAALFLLAQRQPALPQPPRVRGRGPRRRAANKNGQALIGNDDLTMLAELSLRNANGSNFDPTTNTALRTWDLNANATNMAYVTSAQLAATELNVYNHKISGAAKVYVGVGSPLYSSIFNTQGGALYAKRLRLGQRRDELHQQPAGDERLRPG